MKNEIKDPPKRIDEVYLFVSVDDEGNEGIVAMESPMLGLFMPLLCADLERVDSLRSRAQAMVDMDGGLPIKLVRFRFREEIEELTKTPNP